MTQSDIFLNLPLIGCRFNPNTSNTSRFNPSSKPNPNPILILILYLTSISYDQSYRIFILLIRILPMEGGDCWLGQIVECLYFCANVIRDILLGLVLFEIVCVWLVQRWQDIYVGEDMGEFLGYASMLCFHVTKL